MRVKAKSNYLSAPSNYRVMWHLTPVRWGAIEKERDEGGKEGEIEREKRRERGEGREGGRKSLQFTSKYSELTFMKRVMKRRLS